MNICPVVTELFHADGRKDWQVDVAKLMVAFSNFAKAPKKGLNNEKKKSLCVILELNSA